MAKSSTTLDWVHRSSRRRSQLVGQRSQRPSTLGPFDGLSIIDPRQVAHLLELIERSRDYSFGPRPHGGAFIPFRIEKDLAKVASASNAVKDSIFESDEKLFILPDVIDEENGPFADLLDHLTKLRVKMLNDLFDFESKLTVDEVEDELREDQNTSFIEGKAVHTFEEITAILDYVPTGWDTDEEQPAKEIETKKMTSLNSTKPRKKNSKNDESLKWDEEDEDKDKEETQKSDDDDEDRTMRTTTKKTKMMTTIRTKKMKMIVRRRPRKKKR